MLELYWFINYHQKLATDKIVKQKSKKAFCKNGLYGIYNRVLYILLSICELCATYPLLKFIIHEYIHILFEILI